MQGNHFRPKHRLCEKHQFARFFSKEAEVLFLRRATVFRIPNTLSHHRMGMTLKIKATSVQRNKLKRIVREVFRQHRGSDGNFDWNIVVKGSLQEANHEGFRAFRKALSDGLSSGAFVPTVTSRKKKEQQGLS